MTTVENPLQPDDSDHGPQTKDPPPTAASHNDGLKFVLGLVNPSSRSNVNKINLHFFLDYTAYFTYNPVFHLLQYFRNDGDLQVIMYMSIAYLVAGFLGTLGMTFCQAKLHQRTVIHLAVFFTVLNMVFIILSTVFSSPILAVAAHGVCGLYFETSAIAVLAVFTDCMDAENPEMDYTIQFLAQTAAPLVGSAALMILFSVIGDTWSPSTMQLVIYVAVCMQFFVICILFSLSYDHLRHDQREDSSPGASQPAAITAASGESAKPAEEKADAPDGSPSHSSWVCYVALANNCVRDILGAMLYDYFPYYAADTLGLNPQVLFGIFMASQGSSVVLIWAEEKITEHVAPYVRLAWAIQLLVPLGTWLAYGAIRNQWAQPLFFAAIIVMNSFREAPTGLSNGTVMRYASKKQREYFGGLGIEGFKISGWVIGIVAGGEIANRYGFEALLLPSAVVATISWLLAASLLLSEHRELEPHEEKAVKLCITGSLAAMKRLARARDKACMNLIVAIHFKRALLRSVYRRRAAAAALKSSGEVSTTIVQQKDV